MKLILHGGSMRIVSLLTPCTLSLKEQQRETPCICEVAWRSPFQNPNRLLLLGNSGDFACSCSSWQLSICAICPQSLSFKWPWRRVMAEGDVLDILLLAHIFVLHLILALFFNLDWHLVWFESQSLRSSLSQPSASKPSAPSSDPRWGALVGCRIVMLILMNLWSLHPFWAEALTKESSLPSLSQSGGAPHLGPRGVSWFAEFQDQGHSPDPPSTYGCQQWCLFWMKHEPLPALRENRPRTVIMEWVPGRCVLSQATLCKSLVATRAVEAHKRAQWEEQEIGKLFSGDSDLVDVI